MIPIRDNIPSRTTPGVNYAIIGVCALVFFLQLGGGEQLIEQYGMIPQRVLDPDQPIEITRLERTPTAGSDEVRRVTHMAAQPAVPAWLTPLTCIFLHGGWLHVIGNLWFLYIFGDNVEDRIGHFGFLFFYIACGVAASLAHLMSNPGSTVPTIGASGAIAGVMGAYFIFYPKARVLSVVPIFFFLYMIVLPA